MSESLIRVEVVTPVHNRKAITLQCLKSLSRVETGGLDIHVVVVDDGSTDGTGDAIREQFPDVEVIKGNGDLWFTEGTNVGVRAALKHNPKYVLMMNDDQVFDANAIKYMVETAEKNPRSVIGALLLLWDTPHKVFQVSPVWDTWAGGWRHWLNQTVWTVPKEPWKVDIIVGNCVLVPTQAIEEVGLMDSRRFPNFGDAEYTPRMRRRNWQLLIEPRARVFVQPNDVPPSIRQLGLKRGYKVLISDMGHVHNLRRKFFTNLAGAPSRVQGVASYIAFLAHFVSKTTVETYDDGRDSTVDLSDFYAQSVVRRT
jgi:glycosyltransferase involved in cell wall biosynthesis